MKIKRNLIERIDIADFAERHDLTIVVRERGYNDMVAFNVKHAFYAYFEGAEVKEGCCLVSSYGDGADEDDAILSYAQSISDKTLVFNAFGKDRREIKTPYLSYHPRKRR